MIFSQVANFEMIWQLFEVKSKTFVFKNQQLRRTQYSVIDPWYKSKQNKEVLEKRTKILLPHHKNTWILNLSSLQKFYFPSEETGIGVER